MKALLFGGTFDPPHAGHMNNLRAAMQAVQPDVVLVMPAGIPPHKHASATPGELRLAMCESPEDVQRLAQLLPESYYQQAATEITLEQAPAYAADFLSNNIHGRTLVNIGQ